MSDYSLAEFIDDVVQSDVDIFGNIGISEYVHSQNFKDRATRFTLFPSWLIDDDVFSIIPIIYGVTNFAQNLTESHWNESALSVGVYIIPYAVVSLYDQSIRFDIIIPTIEKYLKQKQVQRFGRRLIGASNYSANDIGEVISELHDETQYDDSANIIAVFDRRKYKETGKQEVVVFECADLCSFDELRRNNLIGFDLEIHEGDGDDTDSDVARAYLNYGIQQRTRFYPEFMVSVVPKLFVTPATMSEYQFIAQLYSAEYKKGWNLNLDDAHFNVMYKAITGTNHETNNYYRDKSANDGDQGDDRSERQEFGFFEFVGKKFVEKQINALNQMQLMTYWDFNGYDSDTVIFDILDRNTKDEQESNIAVYVKEIGQSEWITLKHAVFDWNQMECGTENVLNVTECVHIQRLIVHLKQFKANKYIIDGVNIKQFNLSQIIVDFKHLVSVHNQCFEDTVRIQRYITTQIGCEQSTECFAINQLTNRRREIEKSMNQFTDHLDELCDMDEFARQQGFQLLQKICRNILKDPTNPKVRDLNFAKIGERLNECQPALLLLFHAGFILSADAERLQLERNEENISKIKALQKALAAKAANNFQSNGSEINRNDDVSSEGDVLNDILCEIHCYLLHRTNEFYRLSTESEETKSRLESMIKMMKSSDDQQENDEDVESPSMDFGMSVARWLPFGVEPFFDSLRDEIVHNKDSTINQRIYDDMMVLCAAIMKDYYYPDYSMREMMGLKLYTDLSAFTSCFRKAHWKSMPLEMKRRYYNWARSIYLASLRFAVPPPLAFGISHSAPILYHGMTKLLQTNNETAIYFGPISTTFSRLVANTFTKHQGMLLTVKPEYGNAIRRCLGIDVQRISCHPYEEEFLLIDQPIPVKATKIWKSDGANLIDHLLLTLKNSQSLITNRDDFWRKLGLKFNPDWAEKIVAHNLIYAKSKYQDKTVFQRLVNELGVSELVDLILRQFAIGWTQIALYVEHELYALIAISLQSVVDQLRQFDDFQDDDLTERTTTKILKTIQSLNHKEEDFLKALVHRAQRVNLSVSFDALGDWQNITRYTGDSVLSSEDFTSEWSGLHEQALYDVYAVHKCHCFTFEQMSDYPLSEFQRVVGKSDVIHAKTSAFLRSDKWKIAGSHLSLYPSWLLKDDIFEIITLIYGITNFVSEVMEIQENLSMNIKSYIIPQSIVCAYDAGIEISSKVPQIRECLQNINVRQHRLKVCDSALSSPSQVSAILEEFWNELNTEDIVHLGIFIDRRNYHDPSSQTLAVFDCGDWNEFHKNGIRTSHSIGFDFDISQEDGCDVVRAYLNYGRGQRIRFYPEFMMSVIPKLFVSTSTMTTYEFIRKLYSPEYKHGWRVNLDDEKFNVIYKAITGYDHVTNNYFRPNEAVQAVESRKSKFGFFEFLQRRFGTLRINFLAKLMGFWLPNHYDSDTAIYDILVESMRNDEKCNTAVVMDEQSDWLPLKQSVLEWEQIQCGRANILDIESCIHLTRLLANLRKFRENNYVIDAVIFKQFDLGQLIRDFDHLMSVHDILNTVDIVHFHQYIAKHIACEQLNDCMVLNHFRFRQRQQESIQLSIHAPLECIVLKDVLCGIHCYLLHPTDELYRLTRSRFVSSRKSGQTGNITDEAVEPLSIDFGVSVLKWLPFGVEPIHSSLMDEMMHHRDSHESLITEDEYKQMEIMCLEKIQNTDFELEEMMGLKFYSDRSKLTTFLRKAHWKSIPLDMRRRHYHWAKSIYMASIRYAVPIPRWPTQTSSGKTIPHPLYHGLKEVLRMDAEAPTFNGPLSTTMTVNVANEFANQQGTRLKLQTSYDDKMKRTLGVDLRSISKFSREQEILLVNQPLNVKQTKTWESKTDTLINLLLYTLKSRKTEIKDAKSFYQKLGTSYRSQWAQQIAQRKILYERTEFKGRSVLQRIIFELKIKDILEHFARKLIDMIRVNELGTVDFALTSPEQLHFEECEKIHFFSDHNYHSGTISRKMKRKICVQFLVEEFTSFVWFNKEKLRKIIVSGYDDFQAALHHYGFIFETADRNVTVSDPRMSVDDFVNVQDKKQLNGVQDAFVDGSFEMFVMVPAKEEKDASSPRISVKKFEIHVAAAEQMLYESHRALVFDTKIQLLRWRDGQIRGGRVDLLSASPIIIGKEGGINGSNCGLRGDLKFDIRYHLKYGAFIDNLGQDLEHKSKLDDITIDGAGGGVISLLTADSFVNDGDLLCDPSKGGLFSGGSICILSVGSVVNGGRITCGKDGKIRISCGQFVNRGLMTPAPLIQICDGQCVKRYINVLKDAQESERVKLEVVNHRGHWQNEDRYHPQNLLDVGLESFYVSADDRGPSESDWIIFKLQAQQSMVLTNIEIRNGSNDGALKRVSIEGSVDGIEFEDWIQIDTINKGDALQSFDVKYASSYIAVEKEWTFYRMNILENFGLDRNLLYEFGITGKKL